MKLKVRPFTEIKELGIKTQPLKVRNKAFPKAFRSELVFSVGKSSKATITTCFLHITHVLR